MTFTLGVVLFAVGIGVSIALHEFGHLLTAKAFGMKATKYFVGFGPTVFSFRRGETEYGLKAIPAGGYVKIVGMTPLEDDEELAAPGGGPAASPFPPPGASPQASAGLDQPAGATDPSARVATGAQPAAEGATPADVTTAAGAARAGAAPPAVADLTQADVTTAAAAARTAGPEPVTVRVGGADVRATGGARAFWRFPAWQRTVVLMAGSVTHLIIAMIVLYGAALTSGLPLNHAVVGEVQSCVVPTGQTNGDVRDCQAGDPAAPAVAAGLRPGDRITRVGSTRINTFDDLVNALRSSPGQTTTVTYVRDGTERTVTMPIAAVERKPTGSEKAGANGLTRVGAIGISPSFTEKFGPVSAVGATVRFTGTILQGTFGALAKFPQKIPTLFGAIAGEERDPNGPVSVVGVSRVGGQALQAGSALIFILLFAGFNIFVGVFNLFPLLPLDGGHIAILLFEKVRSRIARALGRTDPGRVDYAKLMPLTMLVIAVFGGISLLAILADIVNPIANPFQ
jgi:membrane-associated protease RseP (regulator of RpoE activity)